MGPEQFTVDTFNNIRAAIQAKIEAETTDEIQEVHFAERLQFDGSPAALIGVSDNEALYNSNAVDRMTFVFTIRVYVPLEEDDDGFEEEERRLGVAYSKLISIFANRRALLSSGVDIVEPTPSAWGFEQRAESVYRYCSITLRCVKFVRQV